MSLLDRYIVREMIVPFIAGTLIVVLMFQANAYIYIAKNFNTQNIPIVAQFQWIMFQTPSFMEMTLPAGTSLAAALAVTRLQRESEITALRAAGVPVMRILLPVFLFGAVVSVANFYIVDRVVPISSKRAFELEKRNAYLGVIPNMKDGAVLRLRDYAVYLGLVVRDGKSDALTITQPLLIERPSPDQTYIISAKTGRYRQGIWSLDNAVAYNFQGADLTAMKVLGTMVVKQEINLEQFFEGDQQNFNYDTQSTPELIKSIRESVAMHADARPGLVELNKRFSVPASCAVFAITSCVFSVFFAKSGGFVGVLVSFFVVMLYYNAFVISTAILGKMESVPPWLAAWLPNLLFASLGLLAIRKLE